MTPCFKPLSPLTKTVWDTINNNNNNNNNNDNNNNNNNNNKNFELYIEKLGIQIKTEHLQKTALLGTARILRRTLEN